MKKAAIFTLGCKVNQYESDSIAEQMKVAGYDLVPWNKKADLYIVHTCAVTAQAAAKSRQQINAAHRRNPEAEIIVMGCYAQMESTKLAQFPGVKYVVGTMERQEFLDNLLLVEGEELDSNLVRPFADNEEFEEMKGFEVANYTRPMIKIQEGCNNFCSYCIIPYLRGPERSREAANIVAEAQRYAEAGYKELVLTGIHLSAWGQDFQEKKNLAYLLKLLIKIPKLERVRLSSVEPTDLDAELIELMASTDKICRHLHIPLQSGCDSVLKNMNRRYDTAYYRQLVKNIRSSIPDIAISTDVIVGFPQESQEDAESTYEFCAEMEFSRMHVFRFSARAGTKAVTLKPQVVKEEKEKRSRQLRQLGNEMALDFAQGFLGRNLSVLLESYDPKKQEAEGYSSEYLRVRVPWQSDLPIGGLLLDLKAESVEEGIVRASRIEKE
jgi:threonylcarbamoyladenosine tRNA methylthiotransferase MtaB